MANNSQLATFAGGCFWCTEAIFKNLKGVIALTPGYTGGIMPHPTYEQVSTGTTGHAEAVQIVFDPATITYEALLNVFFATHDPTTPDRQGNDIGPQYRSVIFYHDDTQRLTAETYIKKLSDGKTFSQPIVTQIKPFNEFFPAEEYHRDYMTKNPNQPYCQITINPKISKLKEKFISLLK
ncbi:MAG: peptide-methionine (S)-S-oxide reductase MsrA [Patescibacteria group bacterium]